MQVLCGNGSVDDKQEIVLIGMPVGARESDKGLDSVPGYGVYIFFMKEVAI